ncbi:Hypothetical predicted protein [Paramuricea clavata]|uniref:Uncharacterized protein n=1 Tax=Paramuricea clavata TaxID=317549 RepID=A0A7D9L655_PARCT|nr:Hypothetical predicted protein [Paramuricea clavata]
MNSSGNYESSILEKGIEIGAALKEQHEPLQQTTVITKPKWISVQGTTFKCGCVLWIENDEEEMPVFALLKEICMVQQNVHNVWFVPEGLLTATFNRHINDYEVNETNGTLLVKQQHLPYSMPIYI